MDHIPLPHGASLDPTDIVPYIAEEYDAGSFFDYPGRSRFQKHFEIFTVDGVPTLYDMQPEHHSLLADIEVFFQTWLFFGLLHEFFGDAAPSAAFVNREGGLDCPVLTTVNLPRILDKWVADRRDGSAATDRMCDHLGRCLTMSSDMIWQLSQRTSLVEKSVLLAIASLGETLECALRHMYSKEGRRASTWTTGWNMFKTYFDVTAPMVKNGWCPTVLNRTEKKHWRGLMATYYLGKVFQPRIKCHSNCSVTACAVSKNEMSGTAYQHRCPKQDCKLAYAAAEDMTRILEAGDIALLKLTRRNSASDIEVEFVSSRDYPTYVAISHVWSDGLGNPTANALPNCQIAYVADAVESIYDRNSTETIPLLVWLDTLCCPASNPYHRNLCLKRMDQIYRGASHVLILDPPLSALNRSDMDSLEICARVVFSGWNTRLWTLQEGVLPRKLLVKFEGRRDRHRPHS